jgi:hypothetical protein
MEAAGGFTMTALAEKLIARHEARYAGKLSGMWDSGELLGRVAIVEDNGHTVTVVAEDGYRERWNRVEFMKKFKQV